MTENSSCTLAHDASALAVTLMHDRQEETVLGMIDARPTADEREGGSEKRETPATGTPPLQRDARALRHSDFVIWRDSDSY